MYILYSLTSCQKKIIPINRVLQNAYLAIYYTLSIKDNIYQRLYMSTFLPTIP